MRTPLLPAALALALALGAGPAHALFGDDEARKAILDLRGRVQEHQENTHQRLTRIETQLEELSRRLANAQLDNQARVDKLRLEINQLRGQLEVQAHELAVTRRQLGEQLNTVDSRIKRFEPVEVEIDGAAATVDQNERAAFEAALGLFRSGDFKGARGAFAQFQSQYPDSAYTPAAYFWVGSSHFALKDYKAAVAGHQALVTRFPDNPRVPDSLLNIGYAQAESGDRAGARRTLQGLIDKHPQSPAAQLARDRLASLK